MCAAKNNINIDCNNCKYLSSTGDGGFDIKVSVNDYETGFSGSAILSCNISDSRHRIDLKELIADRNSVPSSKPLLSRLSRTIDTCAATGLCGNHNICPPELLRAIDDAKKVC
ncbi:MAG: hypothetical protein GY820_32725 [Gammaproteobacteria bacterium]|nr:hypothetical protein [Gammaproteobacteria bacterium]